MVRTKVRGRQRRLSLGRLPHRLGRPLRYRHDLYHSQKAEPVDVIVYRGKGFQEPWFLIVPPDSEAWLPTEEVVRLYRQRMQIEQCFRDWKSHLGLRGLHLQVQKSERLLRVLMGFTLAYLIVLLLGADPFAEKLRPYFEQQRPRLHLRTELLTCARPLAGMPPRTVRRFIQTVRCTVHFCAGVVGRRIAIFAMTWLSSVTTSSPAAIRHSQRLPIRQTVLWEHA